MCIIVKSKRSFKFLFAIYITCMKIDLFHFQNPTTPISNILTFQYQAIPGCHYGLYLGGIPLTSVKAKTISECGMKCAKNKDCSSFHFYVGMTTGDKEKYKSCSLLYDSTDSCKDLMPSESSMYFRSMETTGKTTSEKENQATQPTSTPPSSFSNCMCRDHSSGECSGWVELFELNTLGSRGNKACFLQALSSGASVRIEINFDSSFSKILSPIEYHYKENDSDAIFYFSQISKFSKGTWFKEYFVLSTTGFLQSKTYSLQHQLRLKSFNTTTAKFFVRFTSCNSENYPVFYQYSSDAINGLPSRKKRQALSQTEKLQTLVTDVFYGLVPTIRTDKGRFIRYFKAGLTITRFGTDGHKTGIVKSKGEFFQYPPSFEVGDSLATDFQMVTSDGSKQNIKRKLITGESSLTISTDVDQSWFIDSCWLPIATVSKNGMYRSVEEFHVLKRYAKDGLALKVAYLIHDVSYSAMAPLVRCDNKKCIASLSTHPQIDHNERADPFRFFEKGGNMYSTEIRNSLLVISNLINSTTDVSKPVEVTWYADTMIYNRVFYAYGGSVYFDKLIDSVKTGGLVRLVLEHNAEISSYEVEEVVIDEVSRTVQLHTAYITRSEFGRTMCTDGSMDALKLVFFNSPLSVKMYYWAWNLEILCYESNDLSEVVSVYGMDP